MHKLESILKNEKHEILWNFVIQMNHQIPARKPNLVLKTKKKENLLSIEFCHSSGL